MHYSTSFCSISGVISVFKYPDVALENNTTWNVGQYIHSTLAVCLHGGKGAGLPAAV